MMSCAKPITAIQQGAQYYLPFRIKLHGDVTSPENVDDIKIKIADQTKQFTKGELEYVGERWLYPLSQEFTAKLKYEVECQISILQGNNVYPSQTNTIVVNTSIIKDFF